MVKIGEKLHLWRFAKRCEKWAKKCDEMLTWMQILKNAKLFWIEKFCGEMLWKVIKLVKNYKMSQQIMIIKIRKEEHVNSGSIQKKSW